MRNKFKLSRVAASVAVAITGLAASQAAFAGAGFTDVIAADGTTFRKATFFAYSPSGVRDTAIVEGDTLGVGQNTGKALRKFVDPLPLPGAANAKTMADGVTQKYIPVAVASKWVKPDGLTTSGDDYYEIGIVEYSEKFHTDLKKPTLLRGYVQIDHLATNGRGQLVPGTTPYPLTYPDGSRIMIRATDVKGKLENNADGTPKMVQALAVDAPHFLGPVIAATKDTPTRLKVLNLLPVGRALFADAIKQEVDPVTGNLIDVPTYTVTDRRGDLFLPVDKSILGAGVGPDGLTEYTQNRASVHLHGGDTPWISDGTPHQWITPAGENDVTKAGSLAAAFNDPLGYLDPAMLPNYIKGVSTQNVPDMNDPGDGAMTLYYPNGHTARMEWYHDHTFGSTRLNVYAGMASAYLVTDAVEAALINGGTVGTPGTPYAKTVEAVLPPASRTIPLVMQDRTFVPDDIALQDAHWNTSAWGQPGDSWFPHVYETVQDPNQANNWNAVGRWHYGPWFWPVFPALYNLPEGTYSPAGYENTVTTTPEGWNDTPVINGVAYPTLEVDPTTYRFRLLNATNDRMLTFNLFEAKSTATLADGTLVNATQPDALGVEQPVLTELDMVPAGAPLFADACSPGQRRPTLLDPLTGQYCTPETWPTDGRIGGVPNPAGVGPTIYQVANESGWLPKVAVYEPTPINYIQDKGRIVVLNVDLGNSGLFLAPAERADVVIDFSAYAGKTLLVYNDSGAPVPAGDPRNDLFTGVGDQTAQGGTEDTKPGYGPNTRTMMQIKVKAAPAVVPGAVVPPAFDPAKLDTSIQNAYFSDPERRPVVAQDVYSGFDSSWAGMKPTDMYGDIYLGSLKNPTFQFTPGTPSTGLVSVAVVNQGAGYIVAPTITIPPIAGGTTATGVATMKIDRITVTDPGKGYTSAPLMSFSMGGGNGAMANAFLRVDKATTAANITAAGAGYTANAKLQLTFTPAPGKTVNAPAGVTPTGYATVSAAGKVIGITILTAGSGYSAIPLVTITNKVVTVSGTTMTLAGTTSPGLGAKAKVTGLVDAIILYGTDNTTPTMSALTSGGGGYNDLTPGTFNINIRGGLPLDANGVPVAPAVNAVGVATGKVFDITLTNPGTNYGSTAIPFTLTAPPAAPVVNGVAQWPVATATATANPALSGAQASYLVKTKTIQELFDPTYGRLNATLGIELPFTSALTQTTIPLGYVDETTEKFAAGETQIWKITHNGVDSHPVHFHLLDVQVINRVGWDGFIQPIEPKEMGWKETVMMSPLEDIIVAVRAKTPKLNGFGVPLSERLMDPTQPEGSPFGFTQINAATGNPMTVTNAMVNLGWEYVWHCHILGHEENDFMRPIAFAANEMVPAAPALNVPSTSADGTTATLSFVDNSSTEYKFSVRRATVTNGNAGAYAEVGTELANGSGYVDATLLANKTYSYKVAAVGGYGESLSNAQQVTTYVAPPAPALAANANSGTQVALTWTIPVGTALTGYTIVRTGGTGGAANFNANANALSYTDNTAVGNTTYSYVVTAVNGTKSTASNTASVTTPLAMLTAPSGLTATAIATTSVALSWTDTTTVETAFAIWRSSNGGTATQVGTSSPVRTTNQRTGTGGTVTFTDSGLTNGVTYTYYVTAISGTTPAASSNSITVKLAAASVPTGLAQVGTVTQTRLLGVVARNAIDLSWTQPAGSGTVTSSTIQWATNSTFTTGTGTTTVNGSATTGTVTINRNLFGTNPTALYFRVKANNGVGNSAYSTGTGQVTLAW